MENSKELNLIMQIILHAGDAQNDALEAFDFIADNKDDLAKEKLVSSKNKINEAHAVHQGFLTKDINANTSLLLVHALDHLTKAEVYHTAAEKVLAILERRAK